MPDFAAELRVTLTGLVAFAAAEEAVLITDVAQGEDDGVPRRWAALPTIAHTSEFRDEQVQRLVAIRQGSQPPEFPRIEHRSPETYRRYSQLDPGAVSELSRTTNAALIDETRRCSGEDLLDPSRNPWLRGRQLWLQIVVRGFWHPTGHIGDYYTQHGRAERALALHTHALATVQYLSAPAMAIGMAHYNLACTQAVIGQTNDAIRSLGLAVASNPDLREHASTEPDLDGLRDAGRLSAVLA